MTRAKKPGTNTSNKAANAAAGEKTRSESSGGSSQQNGLSDGSSEQNGLGDESVSISEQNGLNDQDANPERGITIVIPYLKEKAQGSELLFAVRSIAKNFIGANVQLVVIGDKEDWFSDQIMFIDKACIGSNPQADVVEKMKVIILDQRIGEDFIWSNDDIYFVAPTTLEDIKILKTAGLLVNEHGNTGLYNKNRALTLEALNEIGLPIRNFDTHMPFYFEKEKMMKVFESFPTLEKGLLIASAYYNLHHSKDEPAERYDWRTDKWLLRVVSDLQSEEKKELFRNLIRQKHFLNHSEAGFSKLLNDWLSRQFSEKCRFEK